MKIIINPKIIIMQRNGQFFAGQLTASFRPVQLQLPDILLLSFINFAVNKNEVAERFKSNLLIKKLLPSIQVLQIQQRIQQFIHDKVLIPVQSNLDNNASESKSSAETKSGDKLVANRLYRLSANFALTPSVGSFNIWSSRCRDYVKLDTELLFILLTFSNLQSMEEALNKISKIINPENVSLHISQLIEYGLIVPDEKKTKVFKRPDSKSSAIGKSDKESVSQNEQAKSWKEIGVDGRVPVYFVPHMQNHYPLALGMIFSAIESYDKGSLLEKFVLVPITYLEPEEFINGPYKKFGRGVWLFSNYMWSIDSNLKISKIIKAHSTGNLTIHGGPSTPDYKQKSIDFFEQNLSVDICVHGEGEAAITDILRCLIQAENGDISYELDNLSDVKGITFRNYKDQIEKLSRTDSRTRLEQPDLIPSPYNKGYFNSYASEVEAAIIESNRGCPFGCTFCDWGSATNQKIRKFDLVRVKQEIEWIVKNGVRVLWIADANFGMYDRDIELSKHIVEMKNEYGYPQEIVVNYTKNTTWRLAEIIKIFSHGGIMSQGVISIQTTDVTTLEVINRKNIKTAKYDELSQIFRDLKLPLSTDLMLGLPGITTSAFRNDLQRYFDLDVSVKAYPTQLLPNSPMADPEYIEKYKIEVDEEDYLIASYSYTRDELIEMKAMYNIYTIADGYSLLRYVLRYLQWEHSINAIEFLCAIRKLIKNSSTLYPRIVFAFKYFETDKFMPGGWKSFFDEVALMANAEFGVLRDAAFDTVLLVNEIAMPDESCIYPLAVELGHNFEEYFLANNNGKNKAIIKSLKEYSPSTILFDDPDGMSNINSRYIQYDSHQFFWEIRSPIARAKSASDLV